MTLTDKEEQARRIGEREILNDREKYLVEECLPLILLPYVKSVLSDPDVEKIEAVCKIEGASRAISELIKRLKGKQKGFSQLVVALRTTGYNHLALLLDPHMKVSSEGNDSSLSENQHRIVEILGTASDLVVLTRLYDKDNPVGNIDTTKIHKDLLSELKTTKKANSERLRDIRLKIQQHLPEGTSFVGLSEGSLHLIFRISQNQGLDELCDLLDNESITDKLEVMLQDVNQTEKINLGFRELTIMPEERKRVSDVLVGEEADIESENRKILREDADVSELESLIRLRIPPVHTYDRPKPKELKVREYQSILAQPAIEGKNVIICAPTGSGKTYVAMHIVKNHIETMKQRRNVCGFASGDITNDASNGDASGGASGSDASAGDASAGVASAGDASAGDASAGDASDDACLVTKEPRVLFIVNRVPLVTQQKDRFSSYLPQFDIEESCGGSTNEVPLSGVMNNSHVVVLTAQILVNSLQDKDVKLADFSLLIFDECHHTQKEHPYNKIMSNYISTKLNPSTKPGDLPQIVGLTASVGVGGAKNTAQAVTHIIELSANLDSEELSYVKDEKTQEKMADHVSSPVTAVRETKERENDVFEQVISCVMSTIESLVKQEPKDGDVEDIPSCKGDQKYEQWCVKLEDCACRKANRYLVTYAEQLRVYNNALIINKDCRTKDALNYLSKYFDRLNQIKFMKIDKTLYTYYIEGKNNIEKALKDKLIDENPKLTIIMKELQDNFKKGLEDDVETTENDKETVNGAQTAEDEVEMKSQPDTDDEEKFEDAQEFHLLEQDLKKMKLEEERPKKESKGILFTRTRDLTEALLSWINDHPDLSFLRPHVLVGGGNRANKNGMNQTEQQEAIKKFEEGEYNLLISTTVGEEGLDIPDCSYVIRYDMPGNEIGTMQSRGRIRARDRNARFTQVVGTKGKAQAKMNIIKEMLMHLAISEVQNIPVDIYKRKINEAQESAFKKRNYKERLRYLHKQVHRQCEEITFRCKKCNCKAFESQDLCAYQNNHIVCSEDFCDVAEVKEHPRPMNLPDFVKKGKIHCKECDQDWGIFAQFEGCVEVPLVKVVSFVLCFPDGKRLKFKQWGKVPFEVRQVDIYDLDVPTPSL